MKISKNSWHYRLGKAHGTSTFSDRCYRGQHTTCTYIRGVLNAALRLTVAVAVITIALVFAGVLLGSMITAPIMVFGFGIPVVKGTLLATIVTLAAIGWIATLMISVIIGLGALIEWLAEKNTGRHERKVSLLEQARLDKKEGICTLVEFE